MQYKIYLSEKVTPFYRENQKQFASALMVKNNIIADYIGDSVISIEDLINELQAGDFIFILESRCIKQTYKDVKKIGDLCQKNKIYIEILNPITTFDCSFNFSYAKSDISTKADITKANYLSINKLLYNEK